MCAPRVRINSTKSPFHFLASPLGRKFLTCKQGHRSSPSQVGSKSSVSSKTFRQLMFPVAMVSNTRAVIASVKCTGHHRLQTRTPSSPKWRRLALLVIYRLRTDRRLFTDAKVLDPESGFYREGRLDLETHKNGWQCFVPLKVSRRNGKHVGKI